MKSSKKILIVEDDQALNEAYVLILSESGYDVLSAGNGEEALAVIKKEGDPRLIFLDLRMPVTDGIGFLKQYRPADHPDTDIIVFSNYDADKEVEEAYSLGAQRYILKARATPKELIRIVEATLD